MAKRIYHTEHDRLFQHRAGGNFYAFVGSEEITLETDDVEKALSHLAFLDESISFFGAAAFKKKIGALFPSFLREKKNEVRASTYKRYDDIWNIFKEAKLDNLLLGKMNQKAWVRFQNHKSHNIKDFQNHRNLMHQFLVWCSMHDYVKAVVVLKNPKHVRRSRKIIPPNHIVKIFTEAKKSRGGILLYLSLLALQGPRGVEMRKLKKTLVDLDNRSATLAMDTVKTNEARQIPLHLIVVALFKIHYAKQSAAGIRSKWVFPNAADPTRFMSETGFKTAWKTCIRNAKLEAFGYTLHDWRSTYEMWLEMSALKDIQKDKATGASREQRLKTYVRNLTADQLRGTENVVDVPELIEILKFSAGKPLELKSP